MNHRYLQKFQIKDVVFLAIMSAVALATCAVMPLVISLQPLIFGISQLVTALQICVFFAIGLYKVRKPGSLLIMALMMGLIQLMMSLPMFLSSVLNGVLIELIVLLLFRGYEKDAAVFVAAMLHTPLSLPFNYLYNRLIQQYGLLVVSGVVVLQRVCKELLHRGLRRARLRLLYRRNTSAHQQRHNDRRNQYPPHRYYPLIALFRRGVGIDYLHGSPRNDAPLRV